ncbi:AAC(3) family N-acetyltransferase [Streptomyces sp. NPDC050658]|uniref:AAC(3) family N-acetyltransferase n=1 Tax=Streptomyces sp. NPDC050658 TaxID=3365633 RepID=UPI00378A2D39
MARASGSEDTLQPCPHPLRPALCVRGRRSPRARRTARRDPTLGWVSGGQTTVVQALLDALGEQGTLVVPTQSSDNVVVRGHAVAGRAPRRSRKCHSPAPLRGTTRGTRRDARGRVGMSARSTVRRPPEPKQ